MSSLISAPSPDSRPDRARERELAELRLLLNLSQLLDENPDLSESGPLVLQTISEHVDMMRGAIYILRDESAEITIEAAFGSLKAHFSVESMASAKAWLGRSLPVANQQLSLKYLRNRAS